MRRVAGIRSGAAATLAGALALAGMLALPATAQGPSQTELTIRANVEPNRAGTRLMPQGVRLGVRSLWRTPAGERRPIITRAKAWFSRGSLYRGGAYPRCSRRRLNRRGLRACPRRSIMGRGVAVAFADTVRTRPRVWVVNGGPRRVYLYTVLNNPARVQAPVVGRIERRRGRFRYELTLIVPRVLRVVAGIPITLRAFRVRAGRGDWLATTHCPRSRRWPFVVRTFYSTGGFDTARDAIRCRPSRAQRARELLRLRRRR